VDFILLFVVANSVNNYKYEYLKSVHPIILFQGTSENPKDDKAKEGKGDKGKEDTSVDREAAMLAEVEKLLSQKGL
jgi:hypothetical protein